MINKIDIYFDDEKMPDYFGEQEILKVAKFYDRIICKKERNNK